MPLKTKMSNGDTKLKIAIIGETGCGKSTFINALLGKIVLPESPMTSTPILTYIEYWGQGSDYAEIVDVNQRIIEQIDTETFIQNYCFNVEEQREVDRKRFRNISHATLHINSDFLRNQVQIIDTLGFSASSHDTETTEGVLSTSINLIFYVVSKNMLGDFEIERIQNLLGYRTNKQIENGHEVIKRKTNLSKLYFICNEKEGIIYKGLQNSICRIFRSKDCNLSAEKTENFAKEHILRCNFLAGRTLSCGIYPYSKYLSSSPTIEEKEFADSMERRQKRYLKFTDKDEEFAMWRKTRKSVNRIINKKKQDIEQQRQSSITSSLGYWRTNDLTATSEKFKRLLDEANRGNTDSQVLVGLAYDEGDEEMNVPVDYAKAFKWYLEAAMKNNVHGQYCLATMYEEGKHAKQNHSHAFYWYERAANQGYAMAQTMVGMLYEKGIGVSQSYSDALLWYKKAAEQNDGNAMFYIAMMYAYGAGVDINIKTATRWLKKAAALDNVYAMHFLGLMYENGDGVEQNYSEAFGWFEKAAMLGYEDAQKKIKNWK